MEPPLAEENNKQNSALFQTLIDAIPSQVFYKDVNQIYLGCNHAFELFSGKKRCEIIGKTVFDIFPSDRAEVIHSREKELLDSSENMLTYEATYPHPLYGLRDFLVTKAKFYHPDGSLGGVITLTFDITSQKTLEKNLIQAKEETEKLYHDLRVKNEHLMAHLEHARFVQNGILLEEEALWERFPEAFIFLRPKAIVSGDFYWFAHRENTFLIATVDCTGHGVSGALMTVLAHALLNQIVHEEGILQPDKILHALDAKLNRILQKRDPEQKIPNGMDMALCAIDVVSKQLQFAGAKAPLYYMREKELHVIEGSRSTVEGRISQKEKTFELHSLQIQKDDVFYLFSDGMRDQFGGEPRRKLTSKGLREWLTEIAHLSLKEQGAEITKKFDAWKRDYPQTDDALLLGIKVF
ncbi:MAG: SpoIIE family protein phosphatase [Verrucomicrobiota bacterium]